MESCAVDLRLVLSMIEMVLCTPAPKSSKDLYCSGAGAAKEARLLLSNYRMQAHSFGIFCWPGCFRTTFRFSSLSLSPVIAVMSCRSPDVCFAEEWIGVPVSSWKWGVLGAFWMLWRCSLWICGCFDILGTARGVSISYLVWSCGGWVLTA